MKRSSESPLGLSGTSQTCPESYTKSGAKCYRYRRAKTDMYSAQKDCLRSSGILVEPRTDNDMIAALAVVNAEIGNSSDTLLLIGVNRLVHATRS